MNKGIACLISLLFLGGCAFGPKMSTLREGMPRKEVQRRLGRPDGFNRVGEYIQLQYANRLASDWSKDRADYNVILKNEEVVAYGQGDVRVKDTGGVPVLFIVPVQ